MKPTGYMHSLNVRFAKQNAGCSVLEAELKDGFVGWSAMSIRKFDLVFQHLTNGHLHLVECDKWARTSIFAVIEMDVLFIGGCTLVLSTVSRLKSLFPITESVKASSPSGAISSWRWDVAGVQIHVPSERREPSKRFISFGSLTMRLKPTADIYQLSYICDKEK